MHAQHAVIMEIALLHAALFKGYLAIQYGCKAENNTALHLGYHTTWVYGQSTFDGTGNPVYLYLRLG